MTYRIKLVKITQHSLTKDYFIVQRKRWSWMWWTQCYHLDRDWNRRSYSNPAIFETKEAAEFFINNERRYYGPTAKTSTIIGHYNVPSEWD